MILVTEVITYHLTTQTSPTNITHLCEVDNVTMKKRKLSVEYRFRGDKGGSLLVLSGYYLHWMISMSHAGSAVTSHSPSLTGVSDPDLGQDMAVGKLGTQAEKDRRLKKK